mmetsp:Transcript_11667/g.12979  ORF Transcript_11667/g.12979 Transcript_11667/m.12979 type:complete len:417 (+) Transcript_11667:163-1413(+)
MGDDTWPKYEIWKYVIMPFMSGIVGWATNWLALVMTFKPIEYLGVDWFRVKEQPWGLFGWQGIIPTKAGKMAATTSELMTKRLFDIKEIFQRLEPEKFYSAVEDGLLLLIDEIINEIAEKSMPSSWTYLPQSIKDEIILSANRACPEFLTAFIADMQTNIHSLLDIKFMTVELCTQNKEKVNKIFEECGVKEFTFIRRSGFYFGFLFGCIQMTIWLFYDATWLLPVCGFIVGWFTNYLALKIIFKPIDKVPICGGRYNIQGLFLKRQKEVSETFARVICVELLTTETMWGYILNGPLRGNFQALLRAHSIVFTEKLIGGLRPFALAAMGSDGFAKMKEDVAEMVILKVPPIIQQSYDYTTEALDLENTIRERMEELSPRDFEGVLHPAFEEDEMTLIFVGGVLGLLVGVVQIFALF